MKRSKKKNLIPILVLILLGISLGYALLSQDLTINGTTKVKGNNWSIYFDNVQINSNSVALSTEDSAAVINPSDNTLVEYTVTLNKPGDFYEFTVDAVNDGSIDGMIGEIVSKLNNTVISTTNPIPSYLDYSVTYSDGVAILPNHLLAANSTETYKVRVEFKRDIENSELPTTDQTNTFSFGINYVQKDTGFIPVSHATSVYTINIYDSNDVENTIIWLDQAIPNAITQYSSVAEVKAALNTLAGGTYPTPIYLKHTILNNTVTASYVEYEITEDLATANPGLTAGVYALQGADSEYYSTNKTTLQTAFGAGNCSLGTNPNNSTYYSCSAGELRASARSNGYVSASGDGDWGCNVNADGISSCEGAPSLAGGGNPAH